MENNFWWALDHISHSWGNKPEQKQAEKEYNHWYYENKTKKKKEALDLSNPDNLIESNEEVTKRQEEHQSYIDNLTKGTPIEKLNEILSTPIYAPKKKHTVSVGGVGEMTEDEIEEMRKKKSS